MYKSEIQLCRGENELELALRLLMARYVWPVAPLADVPVCVVRSPSGAESSYTMKSVELLMDA